MNDTLTKSADEWPAFLQSRLPLLWDHFQELNEAHQSSDAHLNYPNCRARLEELKKMIADRPIESLEDAIVKARLMSANRDCVVSTKIGAQFLERLLMSHNLDHGFLVPTGRID